MQSLRQCQGAVCRKLNKLGTFNLAQLGSSSGKKNPIAEFMRSQRKNNDNFEESLLKLVGALPVGLLVSLPARASQGPRVSMQHVKWCASMLLCMYAEQVHWLQCRCGRCRRC